MNLLRDRLRNWLGITPVETQPPDLPYADCLSLDFLFAETKEMVLRQLDRVEALDSKAGLLAGFDGVIITAAVGLLPDIVSISPGRWPPWDLRALIGIGTLGLVAVFVSFIFAAKAFQVRSYKDVVNPKTAYDKWIYWHERESKMQLRANLQDGYEKNEVILNSKAMAIKIATWCLLTGLALFCLSAMGYIAITVN